MTHETVMEIDLAEVEARKAKSTDVTPEPELVETDADITYVWSSERSIEGRTYRRTDKLSAETS
jgi:hypothetical protein